MNKKVVIISIVFAVLLIFFIIVYNSTTSKTTNEESQVNEAQTKTQTSIQQPLQIKYFNSETDKLFVSAREHVIYTDNPTTTLTYYATDAEGNLVHFKSGDRAFVRILGVTHLFTKNTEISHPTKSDNSVDDTIFTSEINISDYPDKYLIKVCLGPSINLDSEGNIVWPFGCFEDSTSDVVSVYSK